MNSSFKKLALGISIALAVMLAVRFHKHADKVPPREVALSERIRRDGKMYFGADAKPFSGFAFERYPAGELKARSHLENGVLEGLTEGGYTNGALQIRENFHVGVSNGVRTKWFENGAKMSEATIENGKVVGIFRRWHENGELAELLHLQNGQPDGESWAFYPSGFVRTMVRHEHGALVSRRSWKDGEYKIASAAR